jgi:dihydrofolate reductase
MRKLVLAMSLSLDGFVCGPNGEIDWIFKYGSDDAEAWIIENLRRVGAHLMGSRTYEVMAAYWPTSDSPIAPPMNEIPKVVFSKKGVPKSSASDTDHARSWNDARVLTGDLATEIAALKMEPGKDLAAHGGATFAQNLIATGLIDEFRFMVFPVALGKGVPLFSQLDRPLALDIVSAIKFDGPVVLVYKPRMID